MLELSEIQAIVSSGFGHLPHAQFLFLAVADRKAAQAWLAAITPQIETSTRRPQHSPKPLTIAQVALTARGLQAFGLTPDAMSTFPREFTIGMADPERSKVLGNSARECARALAYRRQHIARYTSAANDLCQQRASICVRRSRAIFRMWLPPGCRSCTGRQPIAVVWLSRSVFAMASRSRRLMVFQRRSCPVSRLSSQASLFWAMKMNMANSRPCRRYKRTGCPQMCWPPIRRRAAENRLAATEHSWWCASSRRMS